MKMKSGASSLQRELSKIKEKSIEQREGPLLDKMSFVKGDAAPAAARRPSMSMLKERTSARFKAKTSSLSGTLSKMKERAKDGEGGKETSSLLGGSARASVDSVDKSAHSHRSLAGSQRRPPAPPAGGEGNPLDLATDGDGSASLSSSEARTRTGEVTADNGDGDSLAASAEGGTSREDALAPAKDKVGSRRQFGSSVAKIKQKIRDRASLSRGDKGAPTGNEDGAPSGEDLTESVAAVDSDDDHSFAYSDVNIDDDDNDDDDLNYDREVVDRSDNVPRSIGLGEDAGYNTSEDAGNRDAEGDGTGGSPDADLESLPSIRIAEGSYEEGAGEEGDNDSLLERDDYVYVNRGNELLMLRKQLSMSEQHNQVLAADLAQARQRPESQVTTATEDAEMELREEIERMRMDLAEATREGEEWRHANERHREEEERLREELARTTQIVDRQRECRMENERLQLQLRRATQNSETLVSELRASKSQGDALPFFENRLCELLEELENRDLEVQCLREEIGELKGHIIEQQMRSLPPEEGERPGNSGSGKGGGDKWGARLGEKIGSLQVKELVGSTIMARRAQQQQQNQQQQQQKQHKNGKIQKELSPKVYDKENKEDTTDSPVPNDAGFSHTSAPEKHAQRSIGRIVDDLLARSERPLAPGSQATEASNGHVQKRTTEERSPPEKPLVLQTKWKKSNKEKLKELMARDSLVTAGSDRPVGAGARQARDQPPRAVSAKDGKVDNLLALFQGPPKRPPAPLVSEKSPRVESDEVDEEYEEFLRFARSNERDNSAAT